LDILGHFWTFWQFLDIFGHSGSFLCFQVLSFAQSNPLHPVILWHTGHWPGNALGLLPQLVVAANMTRLSLSLAGASFLLVGLISLASVPVLRRGNPGHTTGPLSSLVMPWSCRGHAVLHNIL
jgi:hypothetical protein